MKFDNKKIVEVKEEITKIIKESEDKSKGIVEAIEVFNTAKNQELVEKIAAEAEQASQDKEYEKSLGLRQLSKKEKEFYELLKNPEQAITAKQIDIIPNDTMDYTLANIKKKSRLSEMISFTPSNIKKWILASNSGKASWGGLYDKIVEELSASFEILDYELGKLSVALIIPKAIRDLALPFVDKYFTAILNDAMNDGIEIGYLNGTGLNQPIGVFKKVDDFNTDKSAKDKTVITTLTGFSPKQLAPILSTLSHGGLRDVSKLTLVCNPSDQFLYIDPALYGETREAGYVQKTARPIDVIATANCPQGKAGFTMPGLYSMGFSGLNINEYKETKALDDANILIAKVYGNGRALDNDTFVPFDPTKLMEFVPSVQVVNEVKTKASTSI